MRALASATISFGLVSIPVKLFSSSDTTSAIRFNQIDRRDGSRIKQLLISAKTGDPVPKDEIVKGYEFAKGQYVLFSNEEIRALDAESTQTIDIAEFIPAQAVDPLYLDKVYYLGPDKGGARAYHLLAAALRKTDRVALAKYAARGKQYLVLVRPRETGLALEQLKYADEVRPYSEVPIDDAEVKQEEMRLAVQLVEQASAEEFRPDQYRDEVRDRVMSLIERKVAGEDISVAPTEQQETKIIDMMEALKASIAAGQPDQPRRKPARRAGKRAAGGTKQKAAEG